jgi:hypothetical protein
MKTGWVGREVGRRNEQLRVRKVMELEFSVSVCLPIKVK